MNPVLRWDRVLLAGVLFVGLGGSAGASDVFHACSSNTTYRLRHGTVLASPVCRDGETERTWNEGFDSCTPQRFDGIEVPPNTYGLLTATCCPDEDFATGAGPIWTTPFERADNGPFYFYPLSGNTWTVRPYNHTGSPQGYALVLQCCGRQAECGDGIKECGEQCDPPGSPTCNNGSACQPGCTCLIP